jgi:hypothetical protein
MTIIDKKMKKIDNEIEVNYYKYNKKEKSYQKRYY